MDVKEMALGGVAPSKRTWDGVTRGKKALRTQISLPTLLRKVGQWIGRATDDKYLGGLLRVTRDSCVLS